MDKYTPAQSLRIIVGLTLLGWGVIALAGWVMFA